MFKPCLNHAQFPWPAGSAGARVVSAGEQPSPPGNANNKQIPKFFLLLKTPCIINWNGTTCYKKGKHVLPDFRHKSFIIVILSILYLHGKSWYRLPKLLATSRTHRSFAQPAKPLWGGSAPAALCPAKLVHLMGLSNTCIGYIQYYTIFIQSGI